MVSIHGICPLVSVEKTYPSQPFLRGNSSGVPMRINLRDSNPVRGEMFMGMAQPNISLALLGAVREIAVRNTYRTYGGG
jgi:hypothetical protein